jgi:hypothetical protein
MSHAAIDVELEKDYAAEAFEQLGLDAATLRTSTNLEYRRREIHERQSILPGEYTVKDGELLTPDGVKFSSFLEFEPPEGAAKLKELMKILTGGSAGSQVFFPSPDLPEGNPLRSGRNYLYRYSIDEKDPAKIKYEAIEFVGTNLQFQSLVQKVTGKENVLAPGGNQLSYQTISPVKSQSLEQIHNAIREVHAKSPFNAATGDYLKRIDHAVNNFDSLVSSQKKEIQKINEKLINDLKGATDIKSSLARSVEKAVDKLEATYKNGHLLARDLYRKQTGSAPRQQEYRIVPPQKLKTTIDKPNFKKSNTWDKFQTRFLSAVKVDGWGNMARSLQVELAVKNNQNSNNSQGPLRYPLILNERLLQQIHQESYAWHQRKHASQTELKAGPSFIVDSKLMERINTKAPETQKAKNSASNFEMAQKMAEKEFLMKSAISKSEGIAKQSELQNARQAIQITINGRSQGVQQAFEGKIEKKAPDVTPRTSNEVNRMSAWAHSPKSIQNTANGNTFSNISEKIRLTAFEGAPYSKNSAQQKDWKIPEHTKQIWQAPERKIPDRKITYGSESTAKINVRLKRTPKEITGRPGDMNMSKQYVTKKPLYLFSDKKEVLTRQVKLVPEKEKVILKGDKIQNLKIKVLRQLDKLKAVFVSSFVTSKVGEITKVPLVKSLRKSMQKIAVYIQKLNLQRMQVQRIMKTAIMRNYFVRKVSRYIHTLLKDKIEARKALRKSAEVKRKGKAILKKVRDALKKTKHISQNVVKIKLRPKPGKKNQRRIYSSSRKRLAVKFRKKQLIKKLRMMRSDDQRLIIEFEFKKLNEQILKKKRIKEIKRARLLKAVGFNKTAVSNVLK